MTRRHPVRPRRNRIAAAAATVATLTSLALLHAASPVFWRVSTQAELLRGEGEHVSIDADGRLTLGPQTELLHEASAPFLWSLARAGGALWIGSGNDGRVLRVGDDGAVTTAYEAAEQNVHAIAPDNAGRLLAGTSPEGALYRIGPEPAEMVFDPEDRYIWAVAASESGDVFVATGDQGRIYRIPAGGDAQLFYDAEASHVLALAFDAAGNLLAATGTPGQVIRIAQNGRGFVILDSPYAEIRALRPAGDGALYAVAVGRSPVRTQSTPAAPAPARAPVPRVTTSTTVTAVVGAAPPPVPAASTPAPATASPGAARGAVYRIQPDGVWDTVWESQRDTPYDVALDPGGRLIIGTGNRGRIYAVSDDPPRVALLARAPAEQITSLATGPDGSHYYATSNPGAVYRLSTATASSGTYVSEVHDANTVAAWGALRWHAVTPAASAVRFFSRSGNTAAPNDTWSAWSDPYTDPDGSQMTSPRSRYLQWKAELSGGDAAPTLLSVTAAYLPRNLRPRIATLTVHDPGVAFQQPFASGDPPLAGLDGGAQVRDGAASGAASAWSANGETRQATLGRRVYRKGLRTIQWTASDPNNDLLRFDLLYRAEADVAWRALRTGVDDLIFTWDTTSAPDGTYLVRVVASDARSNAPGAALTGLAESTPFDVDNSPPRIDVVPPMPGGAAATVTFAVSDTHSAVRRVEYSLDTEHWQLLFPLDGIADSQTERFSVSVDTDSIDRLVLRATDAMDNAATATVR